MRGPCVAHMMAAALLVLLYCATGHALTRALKRRAPPRPIVRRRAAVSATFVMVPA